MSRLPHAKDIDAPPDRTHPRQNHGSVLQLHGHGPRWSQRATREDLWDLADRASTIDWFLTTANVAIITSQAGSWHTVDVTLELWDGWPPGDDAQWDRTETTQFYSSSGKLQVVGTEGHSSDNIMDLRGRARHWSVRAGVRPGPGARYHEERPPEGLETYRVQFWPANL